MEALDSLVFKMRRAMPWAKMLAAIGQDLALLLIG
jgi:hypothetical protein